MTEIKPLTQVEEICHEALLSTAKISKPFRKFFIQTMKLFLSIPKRINFTQMARFSGMNEGTFRQNFKKKFDWLGFNSHFASGREGHRIAIAIDPSYISKSGGKTPGIGYFWSGCAQRVKRGLEILGFALVDADEHDAVFLNAQQTIVEKKVGRVPNCIKSMDDSDSLVGLYLRAINKIEKPLHKLSDIIVADAFFSKETFVKGVRSLDFHLISRLRDDANLKYLYQGPKTGKKGRPKKFDGKVNLKELDMRHFTVTSTQVKDTDCILYQAKLHAVAMDEDINVVIVEYNDADKKSQVRKILFSTDLTMSAIDIFDIYRTRFQIEFLFRDAKQSAGLGHCQARNRKALDFAFNMSLSSINIARTLAKTEQMKDLSVASAKLVLHNAVLLDRFISMSGKRPNLNLNNTVFKELLFYGVRAVA